MRLALGLIASLGSGSLALAASGGAPIATASADLDGDGAADRIELSSQGVLSIGGARPAQLTIAPQVTAARILIGPPGHLVIDATTPRKREAIVVELRGAWREVLRFPLGGVGLDAEYAIEVDATPAGIVRYQASPRVRRCDGQPAYLFPERLEGTRFRPLVVPPSHVPASVPTIPARRDPAAAAPPLLYQARSASHQPGASDAGALAIPRELDDGRPETAWREDLPGSAGEGQFFTFQPRVDSARAHQIRIVPGDPKAPARSLNRPRQLAVVHAGGAVRFELPDAAGDPRGTAYVLELPQPIAGCVTVVLESTYGRPQGTTAIGELEVFAEGERAGGGHALLAKVVAEGSAGATTAAAALSKGGAAAATAIDAALATTSDAATRRRLVGALVKIQDPTAAAALVKAATSGWVSGADLLDVIGALALNHQIPALRELAAKGGLPVEARVAAARQLPPSGAGFEALVALAGRGPSELRREVIERLSEAPAPALQDAANRHEIAGGSGDLWRALTRHARSHPAVRPAVVAAMSAALPTTVDYERRYRLIDGIASHGDAAALRSLDAVLRGLPEGAESSALRQVAVRAIAGAPRPEATSLVLALAQDPDPGVRIASLSALADATGEAAGPWHGGGGHDAIDRAIIERLAGDSWPDVRRRAAVSLGGRCERIGPAQALGAALDKDPAVLVRIDALVALVQCKAPAIREQLARTWDDPRAPTELRSRAVGLAIELEDPKLGAALVARLSRWRGEAITSAPALALAQSAAAAIGRLNPPGAARALIATLDDSAFPELVTAAALALGELGPACPAAAKQKLMAIARAGDQSAPIARRAAQQCGRATERGLPRPEP